MATDAENSCSVIVNDGDQVICKKDKVMKVFQVKKGRQVYFDKQKLYLDGSIGLPYGCVFEIKDKHLSRVEDSSIISDEFAETLYVLQDEADFKDNRFLKDDGRSQKLSKEDITALKDKGMSGKEIIDHLIENSTTYDQKNEYSKVKYLKKKQSKYLNHVMILRPTTRLLTEMYYAQGPLKILNIRMDSLSQILTLSNVQAGGHYIVVESCMGLIIGAVLERLGGHGQLINIYSGDVPTLNIVDAYNFSKNQRGCLLNLNLRDLDCDLAKIDYCVSSPNTQKKEVANPKISSEVIFKRKTVEESAERLLRREQRNKEKKESLKILQSKNLDGLIIASKYHPANLLQHLIMYLSYSRTFVVFCPYKEPLIDCYTKLKDAGVAIMLYLSETWCRAYQVLPQRTHPMINMSGSGGYILTGITAESLKQ